MIRTLTLILLFAALGISHSAPASAGAGISQYEILERANALYRQGKFSRAVILYRKAGERGIDGAAVAFNTGNCYFRMDMLPEAAASFRRAVRLSAGDAVSPLLNLAGVLFRLEQYGECIAAYRRALKEEPRNVSAWLYLSEAYLKSGDLTGAQRALEEALLMDPDDVSILYQLAETHVKLREYDAAVTLIREAYARKPDEVDFVFYIGDLYRAQGDYEKSASAFREGLTYRPQDWNVLYKLADVLQRGGKPFLAMEYLQQALAVKPDFSDAAVFLGNLAFDNKWWERSEQAYFLALRNKNTEGIEGIRNIAYEYAESKRAGRAIELLAEALSLAPENRLLKADLEQVKELMLESGDPR